VVHHFLPSASAEFWIGAVGVDASERKVEVLAGYVCRCGLAGAAALRSCRWF
jgi:hypothetical protein